MSEIIHLAPGIGSPSLPGSSATSRGASSSHLFYFSIPVPFGLGARFLGDALHYSLQQGSSMAGTPPPLPRLDEARRQGCACYITGYFVFLP